MEMVQADQQHCRHQPITKRMLSWKSGNPRPRHSNSTIKDEKTYRRIDPHGQSNHSRRQCENIDTMVCFIRNVSNAITMSMVVENLRSDSPEHESLVSLRRSLNTAEYVFLN
mmetsp:Transcript_10891/g.21563  ORF Transcript_10891/g.21563 Transcript_10891/m.21563 type:complete len:112 (-) Transcript_10891:1217-1552(-)